MDSSSVGDYEVFLSFRGADTRQGFTDVLYECMRSVEIRVFRDDDELEVGDKIESILGAIESSNICIPIFSPRFAESKWCLSEVAKMVELKKTIVPVFYNVTSDDVKLKTSLYSDDLHKLEEKYGEHQVQKWKYALKEIASKKGRTLGVQGYTRFCKEFVDEVLSKLGPRKRLDLDYFVGEKNKEAVIQSAREMDSSSVGDYEVFLSFRGPDTRQGFTDVLYGYMRSAEILVFRDDDELAVGDTIECILEAIESSKICIPIFSPRFAESKWCLCEVAKMVELKKTIVPVFYNVTSEDVKLKTLLYSNDLHKLEEKYGEHQVQKWKDALKEIASKKGRTLGFKGYTRFCKKIVDEVLSKLGPRKRLDLDYFVGEKNKEAVIKLLDMTSLNKEVVCVGIYGMGGIGKTTITKLIYNEYFSQFDHCGFLPDIREFCGRQGIKNLPKYLYDNLEPKPNMRFSQSDQIPSIFKHKKVILILDDVDSYEQIKEIAREPSWFGSGSRIILTTRDKTVLEDYIVPHESKSVFRRLEMMVLERVSALELFSKCAFETDSPPSCFQELSERVVAYADGLPLTITVIGKYLRNQRKVEVWEEFIERLRKSPPKEVKDKLMIKYESLEDEQKTIFLDIACFSHRFSDRVKEVIKLLDVESGGMFLVGIHGIGGVGKTTLAKAVFDQISTYFQVCSFIRDIRENSKSKGIQSLKDELLSKILATSKDEEMETMKDKLFNKKILIVLDDVDHKEQIKNLVGKFSWFGSGSRIIITTRNKSVMAIDHKGFGSSTLEWPKFVAFEMRQMEDDLALQLLKRHALGEDSSSNARSIIWEDIVKATGRLPLSLEIVGSYLRHKTEEQRESTLNKLKDVSSDIEEKLKISYEALEHEEQQIFLDIACFFCDKELSFPVYMWGACGYSPNQSIEVLKLLSLIKIVDGNKLWMHDLVRDFGRKIVRENAMDPANRSRLWVHDEILYILEDKEETEKPKEQIEAIGVHNHDFPWVLSLSSGELEGLPNLRYLELCRFKFAGDLAGCSLSKLKWLSWNFCPPDFEASNLHLESLVILDLSRSRITDHWCGWAQITMPNLEVLNLSCCKYLTSTPDLSGYKKLESLILEDCVSLATIDSSIGELEQLKHLNLKGCISLSKLPEELFCAKSLEKILVSGKGQSFEVPKLIGGLTQLLVLEIANVKTTSVPSDIGDLKSLVRLDLSGADVTELPESFGSMMEALTVIKLDSSSITRLPSSIGKLTSLEELYCRNCVDLKEIPDEIGDLNNLRILDLAYTGIMHLPVTISELSHLETLNLEPCDELLELPDRLPESLVNLSVVSKKLKSIPYYSVSRSVIHLKLSSGCESSSFNLKWVGNLRRLKTLELCFPRITDLDFADITELSSLCLSSQYLECFSQLPSSLSRLFLAHLHVETVIPNLCRLKKLIFLELRGLSVNSDKGEVGFAELESVEHLSVHNCKFSSLPKKLRAVYISKCKFPKAVLDLTELNDLVHLEIMDCKRLIHVRGVAGLKSLEEINICNCKSLEMVDSLSNLNRLEALKLDSCRKLREVKGLDRAKDSLNQFEIYNCKSLRTATEEVSKKRKRK